MFRPHLLCILVLSGMVSATGISAAGAAEPNDPSKDPWPGLVQDIFSNRPMRSVLRRPVFSTESPVLSWPE